MPRNLKRLTYGATMRQLEYELEQAKATIARYERAMRAIEKSELTGVDFGDWVQACVTDVLEGAEAECPTCGTIVHDGPCVSDETDQYCAPSVHPEPEI